MAKPKFYNSVLDRGLRPAYSYLPHHPGQGFIVNRVLPDS